MACGCGKKSTGTVPASCGVSLPIIYLERAAMCRVCPERQSVGPGDLGWCPLVGAGVGLALEGGLCPIGHHPGSDGKLKWLGVKWRGIPYPVRLWLRVRHGTATGKWPGCGCVDRLKTICERMGLCGKGK